MKTVHGNLISSNVQQLINPEDNQGDQLGVDFCHEILNIGKIKKNSQPILILILIPKPSYLLVYLLRAHHHHSPPQ